MRRSTACSRISSSRSASATSRPPSAMSASAGPRHSASASANDADASCGRPSRSVLGAAAANCSNLSTSRPARVDAQHVGVAARLDRVAAERTAQIRDMALDDVAGTRRRGITPHLVDQASDRHRAIGADDEHREHRATARACRERRLGRRRTPPATPESGSRTRPLRARAPSLARCGTRKRAARDRPPAPLIPRRRSGDAAAARRGRRRSCSQMPASCAQWPARTSTPDTRACPYRSSRRRHRRACPP